MEWTPAPMLARLDGDVDLARQLITIFIDEYPRMLQRLRAAFAEGSADEVRRAAHALKGSLSNFIEAGPTATAFELEKMGRDGRLGEVLTTVARFEAETVALIARLRTFQS